MIKNNPEYIKKLQLQIALDTSERAYKELYSLLFVDLYRYAYHIVRHHEYAEEIVSDVFLKLWKIRKNTAHIHDLKFYLYKATKNHSINCLTKLSGKNKQLNTEYLDEVKSENNLDYSPEEIYINHESMEIAKQVVYELPAQCRQIFQLVKEEGLQYKDVASALNISTFTVRNQMVIATKKIYKALIIKCGIYFSAS